MIARSNYQVLIWARTLVAAMILCMAGVSSVHAQMFEYFYGGDKVEAGRGGVYPVSTGGYIAVGETFTPSRGVESDIYVVRTDNHGAHVWEKSYNINGHDSGTAIIEHSNGDFYITGVTKGKNSRELFILRIDECGDVVAVKSFGRDTTDEIGWDLIEATTGDPVKYTYPGDIVAAGSSTQSRGVSPRNGYMVRVREDLTFIWGRVYDVNFARQDDYFYGLTEALATPPTDPETTCNDIVACGGTNDYAPNGYDAFIIRCDGNTGVVSIIAPHASCTYGRQNWNRDDDLRSVTELRQGMRYTTDFAFTGRQRSITNVEDVWVLETEADIRTKRADRSIGDSANAPDEGYCIREVRGQEGLTDSLLVVTGYVTGDTSGLDVFVQEFEPGTLATVGQVTVAYGGDGTDWGWSVYPVEDFGMCYTAGYIVAGFSTSDLCWDDEEGDPQDLYLLKTNSMRYTDCNDADFDVKSYVPGLTRRDVSLDMPELKDTIVPEVKDTCHNWECFICLDPDGTVQCDPAIWCWDCPDTTIDTIVTPPDTIRPKDTLIFGKFSNGYENDMAYPNPVKRGSPFSLIYTLWEDGDVAINVTDVAGKVHHATSGHYAAGRKLFPVSTHGWSVGTYIITIESGGRVMMRRIVVTD